MLRTALRRVTVSAAAAVLLLAPASVAFAQAGGAVVTRDISHLGGSTAFYRPSLTTVANLKHMSDDPNVVANIRTVLGQAGLSDLSNQVVATLGAARESYAGGVCSDATPAAGTIVECDVRPGQTLQWMALRPRGATPALLRDVRWAGKSPFRAYLFRVTENTRVYTFVVPKICGNLSLLSVADSPRPAVVAAPAMVAPPPPPPPPAPAMPVAAPAPPPQREPILEQATLQAPPPPAAVRATPFFIDGLFGKDRRVRPLEGELEYAQCSPLAGIKFGVAKRFQNDWEIAGAVGVAISLVTQDDKVRENEVFVDVEANKYVGRAFVGAGVSLWDLTHSDSVTPAGLVHIGLPLTKGARFPVYFLVEGRVFFDHADDIQNNYQFWGGVRVRF